MDICHASVSPLTFEQEHKFIQAIKMIHCSAHIKNVILKLTIKC